MAFWIACERGKDRRGVGRGHFRKGFRKFAPLSYENGPCRPCHGSVKRGILITYLRINE